MTTLFAWECGSHLYGPQELEVHLHTIRPEHEAAKMTQVDQGLWARGSLSSEQGECSCGCTESQGLLQLFASCLSYRKRVQHPSTTRFVAIEHHTHTPVEGRDHWDTKNNEGMSHLRRRLLEGDPKVKCFRKDAEGTLWFRDQIIVPMKEALKKKILDEAHTSRYPIHLGSTKMNHDLREQFLWTRIKR
jgi:hypothetical protein